MDQITLRAITQHIQDNQGIRLRLTKGRSCLINLISFYGKMFHLADEKKAVDVVFLGFIKAFYNASPSILLKSLAAHGLAGFYPAH